MPKIKKSRNKRMLLSLMPPPCDTLESLLKGGLTLQSGLTQKGVIPLEESEAILPSKGEFTVGRSGTTKGKVVVVVGDERERTALRRKPKPQPQPQPQPQPSPEIPEVFTPSAKLKAQYLLSFAASLPRGEFAAQKINPCLINADTIAYLVESSSDNMQDVTSVRVKITKPKKK